MGGVMELYARKQKDALVLEVEGRLDAQSIESIRATWADAEGVRHIILDLSRTTFIDSMGLATLVSGLKFARSHGGNLIIVNPAQAVQTILELTAMNRVFKIAPDIPKAVKMLASK